MLTCPQTENELQLSQLHNIIKLFVPRAPSVISAKSNRKQHLLRSQLSINPTGKKINMADNKLREIYEFVQDLTKKCGVVMQNGFYGSKDAQIKGLSHEVVTKYDKQIEEMLISTLSQKYPDHKFIGEETTLNKSLELTDAPTWIIDPIDGTSNFVGGFPQTAISIALAVNKELQIGIIYNPILKEFYRALKGHGAFMNDAPIVSSKLDNVQRAIIGHEVAMASWKPCRAKNIARFLNTVTVVRGIRCIGCAALQMAYVAAGSLDAFHVDDLKPWDLAAGVVLIREAGGVVYAPDGGVFDVMKPNLVCAGNEDLCRKIMALIKYEN